MKSFVALLAVVAVVAADVSHIVNKADQEAVVLKQNVDVHAEGFQYEFETSNGIAAQQNGQIANQGREDEAIVVQGANSYTAPDGQRISITYVAGPDGYQPQGDHLPTPPAPEAIPDYILRSLEYIRTHPPKPEPGLRA